MKKIFKVLLMGLLCNEVYAEVAFEDTKDRFFPIWGDKVRELGYELPNPYGLSVMYVGMRQDVDVQSIDFDFQNKIIDGIADTLDITARDAKVDVENVTLRADIWVLPFLNVYGLLGHTKGQVKAKGNLKGRLPWIPPIEIDGIGIDIDFEGMTYGGGFIIAGGYDRFFAMVDTNYTYTSLDIVEGKTTAFVTAPRVGYEFKVLGRPLRVWVGAMYQNIEQTIKGELKDVMEIGEIIEGQFTVKQKGSNPWTYTSGFNLEITKSFDALFEVGYGKNTSIIAGLGYRF